MTLLFALQILVYPWEVVTVEKFASNHQTRTLYYFRVRCKHSGGQQHCTLHHLDNMITWEIYMFFLDTDTSFQILYWDSSNLEWVQILSATTQLPAGGQLASCFGKLVTSVCNETVVEATKCTGDSLTSSIYYCITSCLPFFLMF
jgi:hypothetical protein